MKWISDLLDIIFPRSCAVCGKSTEKTIHCGEKANHVGGIKLINNDAVNIISNFVTAILAAVYVLLF